MLADATKDNRISAGDPCTLYYFPEIPSAAEQECQSPAPGKRFVSGSFSPAEGAPAPEDQKPEGTAIQPLIDEAYQKGLEQGRAETLASQQEKIKTAVAALDTCLNELRALRQQDVERMETETVRLALAIAKKIVGEAVAGDEVIHHAVKTAMQKVNDPRQLVIRLNPKDVDVVQASAQALLPPDALGAGLRLEADDAIQRGGCIVETQLGDIDARIDRQLTIVEELLIDQLPKPPLRD